MKKKICAITGTRADYGLLRPVLNAITKDENLDLYVLVAGMHLMPEFGYTIDEVRKDNFKHEGLKVTQKDDTKTSMAMYVSGCVTGVTDSIKRNNPDIMLLLGDRAEMLGAAVSAAYSGIAIAHLRGGEITSTIDNPARHAISKFAHIHLVSNTNSVKYLEKIGEDPKRIFIVGDPGLDQIVNGDYTNKEEIKRKYNLKDDNILLLLQHSVTNEIEEAPIQIKETLEAIIDSGLKTIVIYPNADPGGRKMIEVIKSYENKENIIIYQNIPRKDFLGLMSIANAIIGNSSCGITEAPEFKLPAINIGTRQYGREQSENVINVGYKKEEILGAINYIIINEFKNKIKDCKSKYGDGKTGPRVAKILSELEINGEFLQK